MPFCLLTSRKANYIGQKEEEEEKEEESFCFEEEELFMPRA